MSDKPILVKKVKVPADEHHGGAWKVAYADFVTAMMAFFLLLWLLNATEQEVLDGISNFFTPTTQTSAGNSGSDGLFGGVTTNDPGPTDDRLAASSSDSETSADGELITDENKSGINDEESTGSAGPVNAEAEEKRFNTQKKLLEKSLDELPPELQTLNQSIRVDVTEDGLRVQIVDNRDEASFDPSSDKLTKHGRLALQFIGEYMARLPNKISITGHTARTPGETGNWQLSLNRSNAARRELQRVALPAQRFATVIGKADSEPLYIENPASPSNRRMTVILLRQAPKGRGQPPPSVVNK